jgi:hypothetical protein
MNEVSKVIYNDPLTLFADFDSMIGDVADEKNM